MKTKRIALALVACLSIAAHAANGVIEINAARAAAGNITPGDGAGYPVQITQSGSYILTSNLTPGTGGGITISASHVTIDLNGFTIIGSGTGVDQTSGSNVTVKNGTVTTMTGGGVSLLLNGRVENVRAVGNTGHGIIVGNGGVIANCTANGNTAKGINVSNDVVLRDNIVFGNGNDTVQPPSTYLMFPYIANGTNLDTTFVIANTSTDPTALTTPLFNGTCTVTYVRGSTGVSTTSANANVNTGQQITWSLTSGTVLPTGTFTAVAPGFTGYAIAECNFPLAHGLALLKDTTVGNFTTTTLPAYVIKSPRFSNQPESLGN